MPSRSSKGKVTKLHRKAMNTWKDMLEKVEDLDVAMQDGYLDLSINLAGELSNEFKDFRIELLELENAWMDT